MAWEPIREPYLYGYRARVGAVLVEVLRAYPGDWRVYSYYHGLPLSGDRFALPGEGEPHVFASAMALARLVLSRLVQAYGSHAPGSPERPGETGRGEPV